MSSFLKLSYMNPIRFYQMGAGDLWTNLIPYFEYKTNYYQKFRYSDILTFQVLTYGSGVTIDMRVNNILTGLEVNQTEVPSIPEMMDGYSIQHYSSTILVPGYSNLFTSPMIVQIVLTVPSPSGNIILKSEYICVYPDSYSDPLIDNAKVITVTNDENDFDFRFIPGTLNGDPRVIMMRVEGGSRSDGFQVGGKYTMYSDLQYKPVMLQAIPYNVYRFTVGDNFGVPNWLIDKLNRFFSCSNVKIDGVQYARNEGAKFERTPDPYYPRTVWTIDLLRSDNNYSDEMDYVNQSGIPFTADTTQVSADDETITIDQLTI